MAINDVSLTAGMRSNLLSLQNTVNLLDRTQSRLSSGKKVNTAIDNPVSFFAAQSLTSRASIIDGLKDAMGQAVQTITAADKGITAISAMIEQAKGIAQAALSAEAGTVADPFAGTAANAITYSTITLELGATITDNDTVTVGDEVFTALSVGAVAADGEFADAAGLAAAINANTTLAAAGYVAVEADGVVTISNAELDVVVGDVSDTTDLTVAAGEAHEETMTITIATVAYEGTGATAVDAANALEADILAGTGIATATVSDAGAVAATFDEVPSDELISLTAQYNTLRTQLSELADDSGYKGKNLLGGLDQILTVKFEGTDLAVAGFDASAGGLGIDEATWTTGDAETQINAAVTALDAALVTLRSESSKLSGNLSIITVRQDFSTNMINTLTQGADKLTLADANEEGANMLMLQTRQSLSTTALSMSAQAAQSVLRLFQ